MKIQMMINPVKDKRLSEYLEMIQAEAPGQKGYVVDKIKDILLSWAGLSSEFGEQDVTRLTIKLASGKPPEPPKSDKKLPPGFANGLRNNFNNKQTSEINT